MTDTEDDGFTVVSEVEEANTPFREVVSPSILSLSTDDIADWLVDMVDNTTDISVATNNLLPDANTQQPSPSSFSYMSQSELDTLLANNQVDVAEGGVDILSKLMADAGISIVTDQSELSALTGTEGATSVDSSVPSTSTSTSGGSPVHMYPYMNLLMDGKDQPTTGNAVFNTPGGGITPGQMGNITAQAPDQATHTDMERMMSMLGNLSEQVATLQTMINQGGALRADGKSTTARAAEVTPTVYSSSTPPDKTSLEYCLTADEIEHYVSDGCMFRPPEEEADAENYFSYKIIQLYNMARYQTINAANLKFLEDVGYHNLVDTYRTILRLSSVKYPNGDELERLATLKKQFADVVLNREKSMINRYKQSLQAANDFVTMQTHPFICKNCKMRGIDTATVDSQTGNVVGKYCNKCCDRFPDNYVKLVLSGVQYSKIVFRNRKRMHVIANNREHAMTHKRASASSSCRKKRPTKRQRVTPPEEEETEELVVTDEEETEELVVTEEESPDEDEEEMMMHYSSSSTSDEQKKKKKKKQQKKKKPKTMTVATESVVPPPRQQHQRKATTSPLPMTTKKRPTQPAPRKE